MQYIMRCCFRPREDFDVYLSPEYLQSQERQAQVLRGGAVRYSPTNKQRPNMPVPQQLSPKQTSGTRREEKQLKKEKSAAARRRAVSQEAVSQDSEEKMEEMLRPSSYYSIFQKIKPSTMFRRNQEHRGSDDSESSGKSSISRIFALIKPSEDVSLGFGRLIRMELKVLRFVCSIDGGSREKELRNKGRRLNIWKILKRGGQSLVLAFSALPAHVSS